MTKKLSMWSRIVRAVVSLVISILPLLYLGGYLSFLYHFGIPSPSSFFGSDTSSSSSSPLGLLGYGNPLIPVGAGGITFLLIFTILSRASSIGASAMSTPRMPNMPNLQNMPFFNQTQSQQQNSIPENLPTDISRIQYIVLKQFRNGVTKSKDIAKNLSMDKKDVEREANALKSNGYVTNKGKLTGKGLELLS